MSTRSAVAVGASLSVAGVTVHLCMSFLHSERREHGAASSASVFSAISARAQRAGSLQQERRTEVRSMRLFIIGVIATIAVSACTREAPAAAANAAPAASVDALAAGNDAVVPTTGTRDAAAPVALRETAAPARA